MTGLPPGPTVAERRLSWRVLIVHTVTFRQARAILSSAGPIALIVALQGRLGPFGLISIAVLATVASLIFTALRWWRFTYRIDAQHLVVRQGLIARSERSVPLDRVRGVDIEAPLLHRVFGLATVRVDAAAGIGRADEAMLDAVTATQARQLRVLLLGRRSPGPMLAPHPGAVPGKTPAPFPGAAPWTQPPPDAPPWTQPGMAPLGHRPDQVYARLDPRWLLYAPLAGTYLAVPLALGGTLLRDVERLPLPDNLRGLLTFPEQAGVGRIATSVATVTLLVALGALVAGAVANWGFVLGARSGNLVAERGLLSRRTVSLELDRIRGYVLSEGLGLRLVRAARLTALVTGLGDQSRRGQLLPLGPRTVATAVAARAVQSFAAPLAAHPRAALRRRLVRAAGMPVVLAGALLLLAAPGLAAIAAVAALPGIALGLDRYRSLGHGVDAGALGIRSGSVVRRTVVLQRRALVGWQVRQSWFQRRSGLVTATAFVGAGTGGYEVLDCGGDQALHLIADASQAWARDLQPAGAPHESTYSAGGTRSAGAGSCP